MWKGTKDRKKKTRTDWTGPVRNRPTRMDGENWFFEYLDNVLKPAFKSFFKLNMSTRGEEKECQED